MPLPLVIGAATAAGGTALIAWYCALSTPRRIEVDDRCLNAVEKLCGTRDAGQLSQPQAVKVVETLQINGDIPTASQVSKA